MKVNVGAELEQTVLDRLLRDGAAEPAGPTTAYGDHPDQFFEDCGPPDAPTLVLIHGGYFRPEIDRVHARPQARALARAGWRVVLAEYRRIPGAPFATIEDLTALDLHLRATGAEMTAWVGHSAGGTLVLWRALTTSLPPVRAVALAPVADFDAALTQHLGDDAVRDWIGVGPGDATGVYGPLDPTRLLKARPEAADQVHLVHGAADTTVPLAQTTTFPAARTVLAGAHHFDLIDPASEYWPAVLEVIRG